MKRALLLSTATLGFLALGTVLATDLSAEPPPPTEGGEAQPARKAGTSDPRALAYLGKAIERQDGAALADGITAFRAVFADAKFKKRMGKDGKELTADFVADRDGLKVAWMAADRIRTTMIRNGKATTRAQFRKFGSRIAWLQTGEETVRLNGEKYQRDLDQLDQQLDLVRALMDIVLLANMKADGSVWQLFAENVEGPGGRRCVGIERTPPKAADGKASGMRLLLWFDQGTFDPIKIVVYPEVAGGTYMSYDLQYLDDFPEISGGGSVRFPFKVAVSESTRFEGPFQPFAWLSARSVAFNAAAELKPVFFTKP